MWPDDFVPMSEKDKVGVVFTQKSDAIILQNKKKCLNLY